MESDVSVKQEIYRYFAETGRAPTPEVIKTRAGLDTEAILDIYRRLSAQRVLVLEPDGATIRMAPPFSGVPTQHVVESDGVRYYANCAWDVLGVAAALGKHATIRSIDAGSNEPLTLEVGPSGPEDCQWMFHSLVPAAHWWDDIVFT